MTIARRASDDSRAITETARVWYSRPLRSWSRPVSCSFSRRSSAAERLSASSRSFSARSSAFSWRRRSISAIVVAMEDDVAGDAVDGDLDRLERERHAVLDVAHERVRRDGHEDEGGDEQGDVGDGPTAEGLVRENCGHRWIVVARDGRGR